MSALLLVGCGGLEPHTVPTVEPPEAPTHDPAPTDSAEPPVSWETPAPEPGPVHRLRLGHGIVEVAPELQELLTGADDLALEIRAYDPPLFEVRVAALWPDGPQDLCFPTWDGFGTVREDQYRVELPGLGLRVEALTWSQLVLEGSLVGGEPADAVVLAEVRAAELPLADPCASMSCFTCSEADDLCVTVPITVPIEPAELVLEPLTPGDAEAQGCDPG